jgi:hypothetical protein
MKNPVTENLSRQNQNRLVLILVLLNILVMVIMAVIGRRLLPFNIVQYEMAGSIDAIIPMLNTWKQTGAMSSLFFLLGFDYLFMMVYGFSLWFVCMQVAERFNSLREIIIVLAWCQPIAAMLDAIENFALYQLAMGVKDNILPTIALWTAVPKFVIVFLALVLWLTSGIVWLYRRLFRK